MNELPSGARSALGLATGERLLQSWRALHHRGASTLAIANFPEGMEGYLVLTSSRLLFIQEAGGKGPKAYYVVLPLTWTLPGLRDLGVEESRGMVARSAWLVVQGEFFAVEDRAPQSTGRVRWAIDQARMAASRPAPAPIVPPFVPRVVVPASPPTTPASAAPSPPPPPAPAPERPADLPAPAAPDLPASTTVTPRPVPSASPTPSSSSDAGSGLVRPGLPAWPMVPMTLVETAEASVFWSIVGSSGAERGKLLVFCTESPAELSASYGLAGAILWRISSSEGEGRVKPSDVDRIGDLLASHLEKEGGQAVVLKGLDRVIEEVGFRSVRRLLEVARETAERTRGAVLVHVDPVVIGLKEIHQLEDDVKVLKF